jgi:hypothetical protein
LPESRRKKRRRARRAPEQVLIESVEEFFADRSDVVLETHMAGYWNEIGFRLSLQRDFTTDEIDALGDALVDVILKTTAGLEMEWTWMVSLVRGEEVLCVLES